MTSRRALAFIFCTATLDVLALGIVLGFTGGNIADAADFAGLLSGGLGLAIRGLAPTGLWFWLGVPISALWGLVGPALQGMMPHWSGLPNRASFRAPTPPS